MQNHFKAFSHPSCSMSLKCSSASMIVFVFYTRCLIKSNLFGFLTLAAENNNKMLSGTVLNKNQMRQRGRNSQDHIYPFLLNQHTVPTFFRMGRKFCYPSEELVCVTFCNHFMCCALEQVPFKSNSQKYTYLFINYMLIKQKGEVFQ